MGRCTFHSTFISQTQIGGKLENILNKLLKKRTVHVLHQIVVHTSDHWRILQHTLRCFRTKMCHVAGRMKSFKKGHVTCWMLLIKWEWFLVCFVQNIRYFVGTSYVTTVSNDWGNILDFMQNFAEKKREYCCVVQMYGLEHTQCFWWFPKRCCHFSVVQSFQFEITTHLTYLQGKQLWSIDQKYNYRECSYYIIRIKWCFLCTNHVLVMCL